MGNISLIYKDVCVLDYQNTLGQGYKKEKKKKSGPKRFGDFFSQVTALKGLLREKGKVTTK